MTGEVWTIYHRTGIYDIQYDPRWKLYVCCGAETESVREVDGDDCGSGSMVMRIGRYSARLHNQSGIPVDFDTAGIQPGDRVMAGDTSGSSTVIPDPSRSWEIRRVVPMTGGSGMSGGWRLYCR